MYYGGEHNESIILTKPITIRSIQAPATIVHSSPCLSVRSHDVILENLIIECLQPNGICLEVIAKETPVLNNVTVKGVVVGIEGEEGKWDYPEVIELPISREKRISSKFVIECPVPSKIYLENIYSAECKKRRLRQGINVVEIITDEMPKNTYIAGELVIETDACHIRRIISIVGNTISSNHKIHPELGNYLWVCNAAQCHINFVLLKKLPNAVQNEFYLYTIDPDLLNCQDYDLRIINLPCGLKHSKSKKFSAIEGIPEGFGRFKLYFLFQKDEVEYKLEATLNIVEKQILPLRLDVIPNPIEVIQEKYFSYNLKVVSCNSSRIEFIVDGDPPSRIFIHPANGTINGKFEEHGEYLVRIKVKDGIHVLTETIHFLVKPKDPLTISIRTTNRFRVNQVFDIPISIVDNTLLEVKLSLEESSIKGIYLNEADNQYALKGKISFPGEYSITICAEDRYKRKVKQSATIIVDYTLYWQIDFPIYQKGNKYEAFRMELAARVREDQRLKLTYHPIGNLPDGYSLTSEGSLGGKIDGCRHLLGIKVKTTGWEKECDVELITIIDATNIVFAADIDSAIFNYKPNTIPPKNHIADRINSELQEAILGKWYTDRLIAPPIDLKSNDIKIRNLPNGLVYDGQKGTLNGIPEVPGLYHIEILDQNSRLLKTVPIEIKDALFDIEAPKKEKQKIHRPFKLGEAFQTENDT